MIKSKKSPSVLIEAKSFQVSSLDPNLPFAGKGHLAEDILLPSCLVLPLKINVLSDRLELMGKGRS
jgi:hypothetical protein